MPELPDSQPDPASNVAEFTVTEISTLLRRTVEDTFGHVRVRGEISGFRGIHSSGHCYFTLKDDKARLDAVIWRPTVARLKHRPEEGMEVIATGKLTTYAGSSKYQIVIDNIEPAGVGALMALLEERKKKLAAEGLFDEGRKRPLPYMPMVVGVVTSPTGAVIRDVLHRIADRFPLHVIVWPVRVQGDTAGAEVANAITGFNAIRPGSGIRRPDLLIVARGGGSIEDLWGFNDEVVVRAVAASTIPLISAIGHETDWTLIDLAADLRAPTPTGAAEIAVPVKAELEALVATLGARLKAGLNRNLDNARGALRSAGRGLGSPENILAAPRQRLDLASGRLVGAMRLAVGHKERAFSRVAGRLGRSLLTGRLRHSRDRLENLSGRSGRAYRNRLATSQARLDGTARQLDWRKLARMVERARERLDRDWRLVVNLGHEKVLERGYGLIRDASGAPVTRAGAIEPGAGFFVQMHDARFGAVRNGEGETAADGPADTESRPAERPRARQARPSGGVTRNDQGSLF